MNPIWIMPREPHLSKGAPDGYPELSISYTY
jgi:hypothetical protein